MSRHRGADPSYQDPRTLHRPVTRELLPAFHGVSELRIVDATLRTLPCQHGSTVPVRALVGGGVRVTGRPCVLGPEHDLTALLAPFGPHERVFHRHIRLPPRPVPRTCETRQLRVSSCAHMSPVDPLPLARCRCRRGACRPARHGVRLASPSSRSPWPRCVWVSGPGCPSSRFHAPSRPVSATRSGSWPW